MAFKLAVIFATLAYVSAGAIDSGVQHTGAPVAVSYQFRSQVINPSIPYATGHSHGQTMLPRPVIAPIAKHFAVPAVPAVTYGTNYGYSEAYGNNYGYAGTVATVVNYGHYAAEPLLATGAYGYTPAGHLGYSKHGHYAY